MVFLKIMQRTIQMIYSIQTGKKTSIFAQDKAITSINLV